ncbi:hypothetical protein Acr_12g0000950 [Actinidia rufa]|uniref:RNase III domain-containing protein n=1 Tax=Actinidia rufa TaxID=165716 RepID=A0A7J0FFT2_9ERIC|nr:hypothetical protein Acr_12g0000950 [Actinidia rufa]
MTPSTWMRLISSPAKNWFAAQPMKSLSRRLREYGFALGDLLMAREGEGQATNYSLGGNNLRTESLPSLQEVEEIIGYNFNNPDLLEEAFTHVSFREKCMSYERLEYVGDSVLNLLITKEQFFLYPNLPPGLLSPLRAANVDTEKLARVAVKHNLHKYLRHRQPVLCKQIQEFIGAHSQYTVHSNGLMDAPKVLADIVESTIGAIYTSIAILQLTPRGRSIAAHNHSRNASNTSFIVDNHLTGRGKCRAKKEIALNRAANNAYNEIVRKLGVKHDISSGG